MLLSVSISIIWQFFSPFTRTPLLGTGTSKTSFQPCCFSKSWLLWTLTTLLTTLIFCGWRVPSEFVDYDFLVHTLYRCRQRAALIIIATTKGTIILTFNRAAVTEKAYINLLESGYTYSRKHFSKCVEVSFNACNKHPSAPWPVPCTKDCKVLTEHRGEFSFLGYYYVQGLYTR